MRQSGRILLVSTLLATLTPGVQGQTALPPGHPPAAAPSALPPGHPPTAATAPPGHPQPAPSGLPPGHPSPTAAGSSGQHRGVGTQHLGGVPAPGIELSVDPALPPGDLVVSVLSEGFSPLAGATVTLRETVQNVAEGDAKRQQVVRTGPDGTAHFRGIDSSVRAIAKVSVQARGADYTAPDFRPNEAKGQRIVVPVYEATPDPTDAMVGMRGFIYVQLREGEFVFDVLYRVFSLGRKTWVPAGIHLSLPEGLAAFESASPENIVSDGAHGAKLGGSFPPGQKDIRMNFRFPAGRAESEVFRFSLPPHVAEMRVITEYAPGMSLHVPGFEPVQEARGPEGTRVLVTRKALVPGDGVFGTLEVGLSGLPTVGPERWIAVVVAVVLAGAGLWFSRRSGKSGRSGLAARDLEQARRLLLEDLRELEAAHAAGSVGPETYQRARRELIVALARLEDTPKSATSPASPELGSGATG